jgi:Flp pilus assembly pilin Flp
MSNLDDAGTSVRLQATCVFILRAGRKMKESPMYDNRPGTGESGQTTAEYAVMMTVISVGIITALSVMSGTVATLLTSAAAAL